MLVSPPGFNAASFPEQGMITSRQMLWYDLNWDSCGLNEFLCFL
jgi:hypothetical protein